MKIAIVGSRDYPDLDAVRHYVRSLPPGSTVISGGARGVDRTAADEARACGLAVIEFPADWDRYGKRAGYVRNEQIVAAADQVVAFWDGHSRGTQHSMNLAKLQGKPLEVRA